MQVMYEVLEIKTKKKKKYDYDSALKLIITTK